MSLPRIPKWHRVFQVTVTVSNMYDTSLQLKWEDAIFGGLVEFRQIDRIKHYDISFNPDTPIT